jgi:hypothetical protein
MMKRSRILAFCIVIGFAATGLQAAPPSVAFRDCIESIGVALVPTDGARALVPPGFVLVGEGQPVTPFVVRTSRCGSISVDGHAEPGAIVQIGAVIVPPDFTGDINNYTFWYETSAPRLAHALQDLGVPARHVERIDVDFESTGGAAPFAVTVRRPGDPRLSLEGSVVESQTPSGSFTANWWRQTGAGAVKMETAVPVILIGAADLGLTTSPTGTLGQLVGGPFLGFPILQQFNTFDQAVMTVTTK